MKLKFADVWFASATARRAAKATKQLIFQKLLYWAFKHAMFAFMHSQTLVSLYGSPSSAKSFRTLGAMRTKLLRGSVGNKWCSIWRTCWQKKTFFTKLNLQTDSSRHPIHNGSTSDVSRCQSGLFQQRHLIRSCRNSIFGIVCTKNKQRSEHALQSIKHKVTPTWPTDLEQTCNQPLQPQELARTRSVNDKEHESVIAQQQDKARPKSARNSMAQRRKHPHKMQLCHHRQEINVLKALRKVERNMLLHVREHRLEINVRIVSDLVCSNMMNIVPILPNEEQNQKPTNPERKEKKNTTLLTTNRCRMPATSREILRSCRLPRRCWAHYDADSHD